MNLPRLLRAATAGLIAVVAVAPDAQARVPNQTPRRRLEGRVSSTLGSASLRGSVAGLLVERGRAPVIELNADRPLVPASLTKLATTTAAVLRFGPEHRFATSAVAAAAPSRGTLAGDLVLVGGGDPVFVTDAYGRERFVPKPDDPAPAPAFPNGYATVESLAAAIRTAGVRRIAGGIVVDASLFDAKRTAPGWLASYTRRNSVDIGTLSALALNEGFADLDGNVAAASPATGAGAALKAALQRLGVSVAGPIRTGRAPRPAVAVAAVSSPTVADLVVWCNRYSINYTAEMLTKALGARFGSGGTTAAGAAVVRATLADAGIPVEGLSLYDGSGLSLQNRMTPRTIAALLRWALDDETPAGETLRASLPVAGGPGTLAKRLRTAPAAGNLRGKTGLVRGVRGMAGWVTGLDGSRFVYVTLFNDAASARSLTTPIDLIGLALARFPYL